MSDEPTAGRSGLDQPAPDRSGPDTTEVDRSALGRAAAERLRRPARPAALARANTLGVIAESSLRFAAATARPVAVRRALAAGNPAPVRPVDRSEVRPPRWWTPGLSQPDEGGSPPVSRTALPARGLARAARQVPVDNQPRSPGTIAGGLVSTAIPVRRMEEVVAAGPMTSSHEQRRLRPPRPESPPGIPAGSGNGTPSPAASAGATPRHSGADALSRTAVSGSRAAVSGRPLSSGAVSNGTGSNRSARAAAGPPHRTGAVGTAALLRSVARTASSHTDSHALPAGTSQAAGRPAPTAGGGSVAAPRQAGRPTSAGTAAAQPLARRAPTNRMSAARSAAAQVAAAAQARTAAQAHATPGQRRTTQFSPDAASTAGTEPGSRPSAGRPALSPVSPGPATALRRAMLPRSATTSTGTPRAEHTAAARPNDIGTPGTPAMTSAAARPAGSWWSQPAAPNPRLSGGSTGIGLPSGSASGQATSGLPEVVRRSPAPRSAGSSAVAPAAALPIGNAASAGGHFGPGHPAGPAGHDTTSSGSGASGVGTDDSGTTASASDRGGSTGLLGTSPLRRSTGILGSDPLGARQQPLVPGALGYQQLVHRASVPTTWPVPPLPLGLVPSDRPPGLRRMLAAPGAVSVARRADSVRPAASMVGLAQSGSSQPSGVRPSVAERSPAVQHGRHRQPEPASPDNRPARPVSPIVAEPAVSQSVPAVVAATASRQRPTFGLASLAAPIRRSVAAADPAAAAAATTDVARLGSTARANRALAARWALPGRPALDERRLPTLRRRAELVPATRTGDRPRPMTSAPVTGFAGRSDLPARVHQTGRVHQPGRPPAASATGDAPLLRRTARAIVPRPGLTVPASQPTDSMLGSASSTFQSANSTFRSASSTFQSAGLADRSAGSAVGPIPMAGRPGNALAQSAGSRFAAATAPALGHSVRRKLASGLAPLTGGTLGSGGFASAHQQELDITAQRRLGGSIRPTAGAAATGSGMRQPAAAQPLRRTSSNPHQHAGTTHPGTGHAGTGHVSTGHVSTGHADTGHSGTSLADIVPIRRQAIAAQQPPAAAVRVSHRSPAAAAQSPHQQPAAQNDAAASAAQRQALSGMPTQVAHDTSSGAGRLTADRPAQSSGTTRPTRWMPNHPGTVHRTPRRIGSRTATVRPLPSTHAAVAAAQPVVARAASHGRTPLPGGLLAAVRPHNQRPTDNGRLTDNRWPIDNRLPADRMAASQASASRTPANGHLPADGQLGAFVRRAVVVAPPRISVRPAELAPGVGGPAVPEVARGKVANTKEPTSRVAVGGPAGHHTGALAAGREVDGPVIRRSLSGAAHTLFRSLLAGQQAGGTAFAPAGFGRSDNAVSGGSGGMFGDPHAHQPEEPAVIRRFRQPDADPEQHASHLGADDASPAMRARDFDELIDRIVAKLEHRILEDLERRGRRGIPGVF